MTNLINFFDFLPPALWADVTKGTNTVDLGSYWQTFRDACAAATHPNAFIPPCTVLTSASPNWAISNLQLRTGGDVLIKHTGPNGFIIDGATGVNPLGAFCLNIVIDRLRVEAGNANWGVYCNKIISCELGFKIEGA